MAHFLLTLSDAREFDACALFAFSRIGFDR
jgi:hypothetical protein